MEGLESSSEIFMKEHLFEIPREKRIKTENTVAQNGGTIKVRPYSGYSDGDSPLGIHPSKGEIVSPVAVCSACQAE